MNNAPPILKEQCHRLLEWMQNRSDELILDKQYDDMFALYNEWHEWIEEDNPTLLALVRDEEI
tara:strand:+ start:3991 stop:4179 length:189 start_codon:yes stop_codon:yes gene_type:complete